LLLDDPISALDLKNIGVFAQILVSLKKEGKGLLIATHDRELSKRFSMRN
jgi:ABC-2 type transport system ATP-binding protein